MRTLASLPMGTAARPLDLAALQMPRVGRSVGAERTGRALNAPNTRQEPDPAIAVVPRDDAEWKSRSAGPSPRHFPRARLPLKGCCAPSTRCHMRMRWIATPAGSRTSAAAMRGHLGRRHSDDRGCAGVSSAARLAASTVFRCFDMDTKAKKFSRGTIIIGQREGRDKRKPACGPGARAEGGLLYPFKAGGSRVNFPRWQCRALRLPRGAETRIPGALRHHRDLCRCHSNRPDAGRIKPRSAAKPDRPPPLGLVGAQITCAYWLAEESEGELPGRRPRGPRQLCARVRRLAGCRCQDRAAPDREHRRPHGHRADRPRHRDDPRPRRGRVSSRTRSTRRYARRIVALVQQRLSRLGGSRPRRLWPGSMSYAEARARLPRLVFPRSFVRPVSRCFKCAATARSSRRSNIKFRLDVRFPGVFSSTRAEAAAPTASLMQQNFEPASILRGRFVLEGRDGRRGNRKRSRRPPLTR